MESNVTNLYFWVTQ